MNRARHLLMLLFVVLVCTATGSAGAKDLSDTASSAAPTAPTKHERQVSGELRDLARVWADGGGTFGYPYWDKAGERWRTHQITATMYREYVTGYRDRLLVGCELLDAMDIETDVSRDVRDLLHEACTRRIDGLREQQRWLDALILRASADAPDDVVQLEERITEHQTDAREALERSWRETRRAMNLAQKTLDEAGVDRLDEDAFV